MPRTPICAVLILLLQGQCCAEFSRVVTLTPEIPEDVEGFPVLIRISDPAIFSKAMPHAEDLAFYDHANRKLPFEIVSWNPSLSESEIWVRVPKLRSGTSTRIYLRYGVTVVTEDPDFKGDRAKDVWGPGYDLVLHGVREGDQHHSSAGVASAIPNDVVGNRGGLVGNCFGLDGTRSYMQLSDLQHVDQWMTPVKKLGEFGMRSPQGMANDGKHLFFASHNDPKPADILKISIAGREHLQTYSGIGPLHSAGGDYWGKNRTLVFSTGGNTNAAGLREITLAGKPVRDWKLSKVGYGKGALCAWKSADRWLLLTSSNSKFKITEVALGRNGSYRVIDEWTAPVSLGVPQGMDYFDGHVYYYTDGGTSSRHRSPGLITKLRLDPRRHDVQYVDQYAILIDNHEAEGLTISTDGAVYAGAATTGRGQVYQVGDRIDDFVSTFKDFTVSLWFKQSERGTSPYPTLIAKGSSTDNRNAFIIHTMNYGSDTLRVKFGMTAPRWFGIVSEPVSKDQWHHAVGIYDHQRGFAFYLNGLFVGSRPHTVQHTIVDQRVPATVGTDIEYNRRAHFFPGLVDEIRISKSASSVSRIIANYQSISRFDGIVQIGPETTVNAP